MPVGTPEPLGLMEWKEAVSNLVRNLKSKGFFGFFFKRVFYFYIYFYFF